MLMKPELIECVEHYGQRTLYEYESLIDSWEETSIKDLQSLLECVYKDGVKDGISFSMRLDTN